MAKLIAVCAVEFCPDEPERLFPSTKYGLTLLLPLCTAHAADYEASRQAEISALGENLTCQGCGFRTTTWAVEPARARWALLAHANGLGRCPITGTPVDPA